MTEILYNSQLRTWGQLLASTGKNNQQMNESDVVYIHLLKQQQNKAEYLLSEALTFPNSMNMSNR